MAKGKGPRNATAGGALEGAEPPGEGATANAPAADPNVEAAGAGSANAAEGAAVTPAGQSGSTPAARGKRHGRGHPAAECGSTPGRSATAPPAVRTVVPTVRDILQDEITRIAKMYWAPGCTEPTKGQWEPNLVVAIYDKDLKAFAHGGAAAAVDIAAPDSEAPLRPAGPAAAAAAAPHVNPAARLRLLEFSAYLENYLWPNFDPTKSTVEHLMTIVLMLNEKFREGVDVWSPLAAADAAVAAAVSAAAAAPAAAASGAGPPLPAAEAPPGKSAAAAAGPAENLLAVRFAAFLNCCAGLQLGEWPAAAAERRRPPTVFERTALIKFLVHAFQELEQPAVRAAVLKLVSLPLWIGVRDEVREREFEAAYDAARKEGQPPKMNLRRHWRHMEARRKQLEAAVAAEEGGGSGGGGGREGSADQPAAKKARATDGNAVASGGVSGGAVIATNPATAAAIAYMASPGVQLYEWRFLPALIRDFVALAESVPAAPADGPVPPGVAAYAQRFMELLIDLLCQLPTRRFLRTLLDDTHVGPRLALSGLARRSYADAGGGRNRSGGSDGESGEGSSGGGGGRLFTQLLAMFRFYLGFEVDDLSGAPLTELDMMGRHHRRVHALQAVAYKHHRDALPDVPFASVAALGKRAALEAALAPLPATTLRDVAWRLQLLPAPLQGRAYDADGDGRIDGGGDEGGVDDPGLARCYGGKEFLLEVLYEHLSERPSQIAQINETPLFPSEALLWDANQVPVGQFYGGRVMALPKLNLQFLTFHDYLLRSFQLFRLESAYEIREDISDAIQRVNATPNVAGTGVDFRGWARMAVPIRGFSITDVRKPDLGEKVPSQVRAQVEFSVAQFNGLIRQEWDEFREHDVVFLVAIRPVSAAEAEALGGGGQSGGQNGRQNDSQRNGGGDGDWGGRGRDGGRRVDGRGGGRGRDGSRGFGNRSGGSFGNRGGGRGRDKEDPRFMQRYGVAAVRGAEVFEIRDEEGEIMNDPLARPHERGAPKGHKRTLRVRLDPAQYHADMATNSDCYDGFNLLVRRKAKENNFKGILETIRDLMNTAAVGAAVPHWLHDVFLGYGDPDSAHYRSVQRAREQKEQADAEREARKKGRELKAFKPTPPSPLDFCDTFLDAQHAVDAFPQAVVRFESEDGTLLPRTAAAPPFRLVFCDNAAAAVAAATATAEVAVGSKRNGKGLAAAATEATLAVAPAAAAPENVIVRPYRPEPAGPYPEDMPKRNAVRFTDVQIEAIRSGMSPGLTMVVGPPGTGKTDVAVQTISNLYRAFPTQRTLVVAHSNAALNDLFEKIMQRDVDERHLLRLGAGEKELRAGVSKDFSKWGRVNYTLARRLALLAEVERLAASLDAAGDVGYTCETASYFRLFHVTSREEKFEAEVAAARAAAAAEPAASVVAELFPFKAFFANAPAQPLFGGELFEADLEAARGCLRHLQRLFEELEDYRAFELLRSHSARADYLLTKQARIVAMTCTHAALMRRRLVELRFKYDNLVMEEAAQILEVETFIPMLLQDADAVEGCRLKRVMLIGDHNQLPPVVKSMAFQKYSKLDQSLFTRFVRLGTPTVQLNAQGRARPEIAALYNWRYSGLGNLSNVSLAPYHLANAGFTYNYQLVNVGDFNFRGETAPTPHFYQNLGEAEYVVATYQYMRLLGYPADRIAILTTYNGQKALIRDVLQQRCAANPALFGAPSRVTTVDKYQGQQNDYVLLSLVRTQAVGHLRDVRRLIVAMSRARLGLYVFCRQALFEDCYELTPTFSQLLQRPPRLQLMLNEPWPSARLVGAPLPQPPYDVVNVTQMGVLVAQMAQIAIGHQISALRMQEAASSAAAAQAQAQAAEVAAKAEAEAAAAAAAAVAAAKAAAKAAGGDAMEAEEEEGGGEAESGGDDGQGDEGGKGKGHFGEGGDVTEDGGDGIGDEGGKLDYGSGSSRDEESHR